MEELFPLFAFIHYTKFIIPFKYKHSPLAELEVEVWTCGVWGEGMEKKRLGRSDLKSGTGTFLILRT